MSLFFERMYFVRIENVYRANVKDETLGSLQSYMDDCVLVFKRFNDTYKEIRSDEIYYLEELESMIPLSKILGISGNMSKNIITQLYHMDKHKKINFDTLYICDVGLVHIINDVARKDDVGITIIAKKRLVYKDGDKYVDLESYEDYQATKVELNNKVALNVVPFKDQFLEELKEQRSEEKGKVLKLYYSKYRRKEVS